MRTILLTSAAVAGLVALSVPASANDIVRELLDNGLVAGADQMGELYTNIQGAVGNEQTAKNTASLGKLEKYLDPNTGKYVFGSVSAANIGNSVSIEDTTPDPKSITSTTTTTTSGTVTFAPGTTAPVSGATTSNGDVWANVTALGFPVSSGPYNPSAVGVSYDLFVPAGQSVSGVADLSGVTGSFSGTSTVTQEGALEFVKGDIYLNGQIATGNTQYAEMAAVACANCGGTSFLENVSMTAANMGNAISIDDLSSGYRGEAGDLYVSGQYAANNVQTAIATPTVGSMVGGAISAANIANSISIKDACGSCE
ncbi:hypothetical protein [Azospirillum sp. ST 5-10]|uniref:hypothetical protein n=1 Tax=unclassified Azospirillum TaxID=2630922 RepID=UPI003F4A59DD